MRLDGIHSVRDVVNQKLIWLLLRSKVHDTRNRHLLQVLVILGENVGDDLGMRSSRNHELKKSRSHIAYVPDSLRLCQGHFVSQFGELTIGVVKVSQWAGKLVEFGPVLAAQGNLVILGRDESRELLLKRCSKVLAVLAMRMAELLGVWC